MIKHIILIIGLIFNFLYSSGQQFLQNPSFEGQGIDNQPPENWPECNGSPDNPPLPEEILVDLPASDGERYLSMRARGDIPNPLFTNYRGVRDQVYSKLLKPLKQGINYKLSIDLATDYEVVLFNIVTKMDNAQLRIWAGNSECDQAELLASSGAITNTDWKTFEICFSPQNNTYDYFFLEADYIDNDTLNGIILADNLVIEEYNENDTNDFLVPDVIPGNPVQLEASLSQNYEWTPTVGLSCTSCRAPYATIYEESEYLVKISGLVGCTKYEKFHLKLPDCNKISSELSGTIIDTSIDFGSGIMLNVPYGISFSWTPTGNLSCTDCSNPFANPFSATTYTCLATDQYGCSITYKYKIEVNPKIPNVITPNSDGYNDNFVIRNLPDMSKLKIIDRLGNTIYATDNYQNNWPMNTGSGLIKQTDTYWYILECPGSNIYQGYILVKF